MKKYHYRKVPRKSWKRKNASIIKQLKKKKSSYRFHENAKKIIPFQKMNKTYVGQKSIWRNPTLLSISVLVMIILVVPTLIVVPYGKANEETGTVVKKETQEESVEVAESPFAVEVMRQQTETVESVPLEEYIVGVVAAEMPAEFELEALKAQALAARTYTVNYLMHGEKLEEYDVTDTVKHQVYKSEEDLMKQWGSEFPEKISKIKEAVNATRGQILTYEKEPITAAFFSTSNGYTENSEDYWDNELPYLRSVESPWDKDSPKYLHQETFTIEQVESALGIDLPNETPLYIEESRTESGRVKELGIEGHTYTGREIREKLNLKSSDFTIKQNNGHFVVTTEGYGHGIGMSQYGANFMAKSGKNYEDIVKHYYQGIQISSIDDAVPTLVSR